MAKLVLDGTFYGNDPLKNIGLQSHQIVYAAKIFTTVDGTKLPRAQGLPPRDRVEQLAEGAADRFQFDIEGSDWASHLEYYETVSGWVKAVAPDKKFGWYRIVPRREFWKTIEEQRIVNNKRQGIADRVDTFYPSFYNLFDDPTLQRWKFMASTNMQEARRMAHNDQQVYPYLWPQYHPGSSDTSIRLDYIPYAMFKEMMEFTLTLADGFVLWGGYDFSVRKPITWSSTEENSGWYKALKEVMANLDAIPDPPEEPEPEEPEPEPDPALTVRVEALESQVAVLESAVSGINTRLDEVDQELHKGQKARTEAGAALSQ